MIRLFKVFMIFLLALMTIPAAAEDEKEGGILGTGIVGTITRLGSVWVNGVHIRFADDLAVEGGVVPLAATALRPGHTVAIVAQRSGKGWIARDIRQVLPLVGPVEKVIGGRAIVLGTTVDLPQNATVYTGEWIAVSGLWREDRVIASRVDEVPEGARVARVSGSFTGLTASGALKIGKTKIHGIAARHLSPGDLVTVYGKPRRNGMNATRIETGLFGAAVGLILAEGYLSPPAPDGLYTLLGSGLVAYTDQPGMIDPAARQLRCGQDGTLGVAGDGDAPESARALGCE